RSRTSRRGFYIIGGWFVSTNRRSWIRLLSCMFSKKILNRDTPSLKSLFEFSLLLLQISKFVLLSLQLLHRSFRNELVLELSELLLRQFNPIVLRIISSEEMNLIILDAIVFLARLQDVRLSFYLLFILCHH